MKEARAERKNLVATWLDIADAHGATPHQLISIALRRAHVPEKVVQYIEEYYKEVSIISSLQKMSPLNGSCWKRGLSQGVL